MADTLELDDLQGIIARGYGNLTAARFSLLEIVDPGAARSWLLSLADTITSGNARPATSALNLAFTAPGLRRLGLDPALLTQFSNEFVGGMTTPHRRRILGDQDEDSPERWLWGGPATRAVDMLLMFYALDDATLASFYDRYAQGFAAGGLSEIQRLETFDLGDVEPFGLRDGVSQPFVEGLSKSGPPANTVKAGEFILGYRNEYDLYTDRPTLDRGAAGAGLLPLDPSGPGRADLGRNGSYLVFRQLEQDVAGFWRFIDRATLNPDGSSNPTARTWLAARMVGRWPSGAPLARTPDADAPELAEWNDFGYAERDAAGLLCPIGAHIRRANPRDSLDPEPGSAKSISIGKRHRILRRGREYGSPMPLDAALSVGGAAAEAGARGLHFICLAANIARQFEFIQHTWLNNPKFDGLYEEVDPLVGARHPTIFAIPGKPVRRRVADIPRFTTVRGGQYFFLPGIRAVRYLANLGQY